MLSNDVNPPSFLKYDPRNDVEIQPVSDNEERQIERFFKECYHTRVISFAEKCPTFKRKKLFEMLHYASQNMSKDEVAKRNFSQSIQGEKPGTDIAFTANGGFGLSYSSSTVTGKRSSRKISPQRFQSPGITENAIFGYPSMSSIYNNLPTTNQMPNFYDPQPAPIGSPIAKSRSIQTSGGNRNDATHLTIIRMVKPECCQSLINISDEYGGLWVDLSKIIDKRGMFSNTTPRRTYGGISNSQAILDLSPAPFMTMSKHQKDFNKTTGNIQTREVSFDPSSSKTGNKGGISRNLSFSLRLDDPTMRTLYQSDSRWSPRTNTRRNDQ